MASSYGVGLEAEKQRCRGLWEVSVKSSGDRGPSKSRKGVGTGKGRGIGNDTRTRRRKQSYKK